MNRSTRSQPKAPSEFVVHIRSIIERRRLAPSVAAASGYHGQVSAELIMLRERGTRQRYQHNARLEWRDAHRERNGDVRRGRRSNPRRRSRAADLSVSHRDLADQRPHLRRTGADPRHGPKRMSPRVAGQRLPRRFGLLDCAATDDRPNSARGPETPGRRFACGRRWHSSYLPALTPQFRVPICQNTGRCSSQGRRALRGKGRDIAPRSGKGGPLLGGSRVPVGRPGGSPSRLATSAGMWALSCRRRRCVRGARVCGGFGSSGETGVDVLRIRVQPEPERVFRRE
ncbi:hypothetical protein BDZ31_003049 [Conexibacter arvalis]|uniref:Uncharacterized protein n=1 Tax=Conexibacter arvalis TaxID=912552 RepID=A0A840IHB1_9ACTN|nr:hypothetical protein [Conexibacter arvalis]